MNAGSIPLVAAVLLAQNTQSSCDPQCFRSKMLAATEALSTLGLPMLLALLSLTGISDSANGLQMILKADKDMVGKKTVQPRTERETTQRCLPEFAYIQTEIKALGSVSSPLSSFISLACNDKV